MVSKKLHFKVNGEGITNLVRQIYLYEEKEKAWNIMDTLNGITVQQSKDVFQGDAKLVNDPNDDTIVLLEYEEDKEWKKEFQDKLNQLKKDEEHSRYVTELAEELQSRYNGTMSIEEARQWIINTMSERNPKTYSSDGILYYAMKTVKEVKIAELGGFKQVFREDFNDVTNTINLENMQQEANQKIAKAIFIDNFNEKDKEKKKVNEELMKTFANKRYSFVFKGHDYSFDDSARNQRECPHCGKRAPDDNFWRETDEGYIGYYDFGQGEVAVCFECPECFENFYYHYNKKYFLRKKEEN